MELSSPEPTQGLASSRGPLGPVGPAGPVADVASLRHSAVSWSAVAAGAAAAASLSLILLILGVGLGLSSVSPWARDGVSATTFGVSTIVWLTLTQGLAAALGGYLAGRLRTRWAGVHADEVYFRDTAHGFLSWAVASLATAVLLTSVIGSILSGGLQAGATVMGGVAGTASAALGGAAGAMRPAPAGAAAESGAVGYLVDALFRRDATAAAGTAVGASAAGGSSTGSAPSATSASNGASATSADTAEIARIFMNVSRTDPLPPDDLRHVANVVAQRTGLSPQDAERRVATVYARAQAKLRDAEQAAREATDQARKASAYSALWLFVSLLVGAFAASLAATFGGRRRDA